MSGVIDQANGTDWTLYHGDTVDVARGLPDHSVDFSVFSPPFASIYTYSNSPRDMGNVRNDEEFFAHYDFLIRESARVMRPGRLVAIHCMLTPTIKSRDGHIGLRDFRGDIIRAYQRHGFVYHSEVCIWKDPVMAVQRTKALGLLYKQLRKDSAMSRQGIADYLVVMRSPGENDKPVTKTVDGFPVERWQRYASPVWATVGEPDDEGFLRLSDDQTADPSSGIDPHDTLQYRSAREHDDERHICPLQLDVIRRSVRLWSSPGDVVWSPFAGIGSEGFVAVQEGRRFVGAELKRSYFEQAARNLAGAVTAAAQPTLFDLGGAA
jgi:DNA modification methylase